MQITYNAIVQFALHLRISPFFTWTVHTPVGGHERVDPPRAPTHPHGGQLLLALHRHRLQRPRQQRRVAARRPERVVDPRPRQQREGGHRLVRAAGGLLDVSLRIEEEMGNIIKVFRN